uniref:Uncharacterized protein n=1 Tax=Pseudo-nitzschia australis TaxID=44445 RepID=A0A7S4AFM9_9STRA|mmetsp:Transcript_2465/g.5377  ORF Transcript_2465/g.5377 Transcript_2465/m.5377 type:complete len:304 (+) Transcript_2465:400-1311(+)
MCRHPTIISQYLILLLLLINQTSGYIPSTKPLFREIQKPATTFSVRQSLHSCSRGERYYHRGVGRNRCYDTHMNIINIGVALASRPSSDDGDRDDFEPPTNADEVREGNNHLRSLSEKNINDDSVDTPSIFQRMFDEIPFVHLFFTKGREKLPPVQIDDFGVMLYDVFLIVNLSTSISFWVTHRMDFSFIPYAFNEGCLFSILWIASGLYHGIFLYSAMDGHFPLDDEQGRGGPRAAAALAFNTYINAINLRLVSALIGAWIQHRKVGEGSPMEELIPLEIGCGLVLMTLWRATHSQVTPRVR